jgi:hypothetical protein
MGLGPGAATLGWWCSIPRLHVVLTGASGLVPALKTVAVYGTECSIHKKDSIFFVICLEAKFTAPDTILALQ